MPPWRLEESATVTVFYTRISIYGIDPPAIRLAGSLRLADVKAWTSGSCLTIIGTDVISLLHHTARNDTLVSGVLLIDEKGTPANLDALLIDEMLLAYRDGKAPPSN